MADGSLLEHRQRATTLNCPFKLSTTYEEKQEEMRISSCFLIGYLMIYER